MRPKLLHRVPVQIHRPTPIALRTGDIHLTSDRQQSLTDGDPGSIEVDIHPTQPGDLAPSSPGHRQQMKRRLETMTLTELEEATQLARSPIAKLAGRVCGLGGLALSAGFLAISPASTASANAFLITTCTLSTEAGLSPAPVFT